MSTWLTLVMILVDCYKPALYYKTYSQHRFFNVGSIIMYKFNTKLFFICVSLLFSNMVLADDGICTQGNCTNGQGTMTWPDGAKYVGKFKNGKYNGQGLRTWLDGEKYMGKI